MLKLWLSLWAFSKSHLLWSVFQHSQVHDQQDWRMIIVILKSGAALFSLVFFIFCSNVWFGDLAQVFVWVVIIVAVVVSFNAKWSAVVLLFNHWTWQMCTVICLAWRTASNTSSLFKCPWVRLPIRATGAASHSTWSWPLTSLCSPSQ